MSPEQKAEQIVDAVFLSGSKWGEHDWGFARGIIATAIREAEDAAYERAATQCDGVTEVLTKREQKHASPYFAMCIRKLKSQEP